MQRVTILMGCSGSGKTTWAEYGQAHDIIVSADSYFMISGAYKFDPKLLQQAHDQCLRTFVQLLQFNGLALNGPDIAVDNTNTTALEMAPYVALTQAYQFAVRFVHFDVAPAVAFTRSQHGVPLHTIENQHRRIQETLKHWPRFWPKPERITDG